VNESAKLTTQVVALKVAVTERASSPSVTSLCSGRLPGHSEEIA